MAVFNKVNAFVEALAHAGVDLETDTIKAVLSNTAIDSADVGRADITEISAGNGYTAGGNTITTSSSGQTSGTYRLILADLTITASGGPIGPFRYIGIVDETATGDPILGWYDYGEELTLSDGSSLVIDFNASTGIISLA